MLEFWLSLTVFLGSHMAISRSRLKPFLISRIGKRRYLIAYSALSVILLGWLIVAAQSAPRIQLWPWEHWLYWIPNILMPFAFILLVAGFIVPNPLSYPQEQKGLILKNLASFFPSRDILSYGGFCSGPYRILYLTESIPWL